MDNQACVFCLMQQRAVPFHQVWEDKKHFAFLSIFPNTEGFTVVATKAHHGSYAFDQADAVLSDLVLASKKTAQVLTSYFADVERCGMFFEGYGVDHLHSKLFPMHGTGGLQQWQKIESQTNKQFFPTYPGYLSSNDSARANDAQLAKLAKEIRACQKSENLI
jgi:histidine triad (HIT) family protein